MLHCLSQFEPLASNFCEKFLTFSVLKLSLLVFVAYQFGIGLQYFCVWYASFKEEFSFENS